MTSTDEMTLLPLMLVAFAACANALTVVCTEYLESIGARATWYQCWVAEYVICALLSIWYWIVSFALNYYYPHHANIFVIGNNSNTQQQLHPQSEYRYHQINTSTDINISEEKGNTSINDLIDHQTDTSTRKYGSVADLGININNDTTNKSDNINVSFWSYLWSVFPPLDKQHSTHWWVLIVRSVSGILCFAGLDIALIYLDSGDTILIQIVLVTLLNLLFGVIFFHEKLQK